MLQVACCCGCLLCLHVQTNNNPLPSCVVSGVLLWLLASLALLALLALLACSLARLFCLEAVNAKRQCLVSRTGILNYIIRWWCGCETGLDLPRCVLPLLFPLGFNYKTTHKPMSQLGLGLVLLFDRLRLHLGQPSKRRRRSLWLRRLA